jgi:hypothetical protein
MAEKESLFLMWFNSFCAILTARVYLFKASAIESAE